MSSADLIFNTLGHISLDASSFIMDQMVMGSSELMNDGRLPSIETWSEWICTVILSSVSAELLDCKTVINKLAL